MARQRMVTRSVNVTYVKAIQLDVITVETSVRLFELTGGNYTEDKALKAIKADYDTAETKVVAVQDMWVREEMYGMSELKFIMTAERLDPATRKALEAEENTSDEVSDVETEAE